MNLLRITYLFVLITIIGCSEGGFPSNSENSESTRLAVNSEISNLKPVNLRLSTEARINAYSEIKHPENAELFLRGTGLDGAIVSFSYSTKDEMYKLRDQKFRPIPGGEYELFGGIPEMGIDSIRSFTSIPEMGLEILSQKVLERGDEWEGSFLKESYTVEVELSNTMVTNMVRVVPKYRVSNYSIDTNGQKIVESRGEWQNFEIVNDLTANKSIQELYLEEGIYFRPFELSETQLEFELALIEGIDPSRQFVESVTYDIETLSEEAFDYRQYLSKVQEALDSPNSQPITTVTNIDRGLGVFAGMLENQFSFSL